MHSLNPADTGVYFSADNGATSLNTFNPPGGGDLSDWAGATNDSYNAFSNPDVKNDISSADQTVMSVLGYSPNLLQNGTFEDGTLTGWGSGGSVGVVQTQSGHNLVAAAFPLAGTGSRITQLITGLASNTTYILTGYTKVQAAGDQAIIGVRNFNSNHNPSNIRDTMTNTTWAQGTISFTTGPNNTTALVYFLNPAVSGTDFAYGDDFVVTKSLVQNPDFETGDSTGWTFVNNASVTSSTSNSGTYSLQLSAGSLKARAKQTISGLTAFTNYTLTAFVKTTASTDVVALTATSYNGNSGFTQVTSSSTGWTQITLNFTTGAATDPNGITTSALIYVVNQSNTNAVFADDFELYQTNP